jgi:hypothetical protein
MQAAEASGFESAWTVEHAVIPRGYQSAYPYTSDGRLPGGEGEFLLPDPLICPVEIERLAGEPPSVRAHEPPPIEAEP